MSKWISQLLQNLQTKKSVSQEISVAGWIVGSRGQVCNKLVYIM